MRGMSTRQATKWTTILLTLLAFITACSPSDQSALSPVPLLPTSTPLINIASTISTNTPVPTQLTCLTQPGRVELGKLETTDPPQEYRIYLPPCYDELTEKRYPVLYLLHGQTYTSDQWIRIGAIDALDQLSLSGEAQPFIIVLPNDRYWVGPIANGFGERLVEALVPFIDETYRTIPDRKHRAIGGMSRGSGWALRLGLTRSDLFSIIGLHSLAVLQGDGSKIERWVEKIPSSSLPAIFMDIGESDQEVDMALSVVDIFTQNGIPLEWHLYTGAHTEEYWSAHVAEYIGWYASQWNNP
jgi:enterochelin esterase-like enzyme